MTERRIRGVDVSAFQGVITDAIAQALVAEGCVFAYVRAAVGTGTKADDRFLANVAVLQRAGIAVGPYFFPYPLIGLDPVGQARLHMQLAAYLGSHTGELAPMIDAEWPPRETRLADGAIEQTWVKRGLSAAQQRAWLEAYGDEIDRLSGCDCPFYSYAYQLSCYEVWLSPKLCARPLHLANYSMQGRVPTDAELAKLVPPKGYTKITTLQHDGTGGLRLPTAAGPNTGNDVDWNVMLDANDLWRLMGQQRDPEPTAISDDEIAKLAAVAHEQASDLIVDDMIADYRRTRIDEAV